MNKIIFFLIFANVLFANDTSVVSSQTVSGHVDRGQSNYYLISASRGDVISSILEGLTDNADVYVRVGARPTSSSYDCKSTNGGIENDSCSALVDHDATVYIRVYGRRATNYQVTATKNHLAENDTLVTSGESVSGHVNRGKSHYYLISASSGDTITSNLTGLSDNANIYVRVGRRPTSSKNDCKSTNAGTQNESCSVTLDHDARVYVRVYGRRAADYQITVTKSHDEEDPITTLTSAQAISSAVNERAEKHYKIDMTAGQSLDSLISNLSADSDLYVKMGELPTGSSFDCKSTKGNTQDDGCSITATQNTTAFITVYGYQSSNYTITATLHNGNNGGGIPTLVSGESVSASVARGDMKYYKIQAHLGDKIIATISGLTNIAHIYMKKGEKPTRASYDCRGVDMGATTNSCSLSITDDTEVFIGVSGFRASDYLLRATAELELIPANPEVPTVLEDAEGGTLNPNWQTVLGNQPSYIYPTPDIPGAPEGTGVLVQHANGGATIYRYHLPVNNTSQRVLSMDMGGLPTHLLYNHPESHRGFIPHYGVGVIVETKLGRRIMTWDSWYTHQGYPPRKHDNGHNIFLNYPSPVEMVRGYGYSSTSLWNHFEVNIDDELHRLEPNNEIIKIIIFHTTGGYLDNITLSAAE